MAKNKVFELEYKRKYQERLNERIKNRKTKKAERNRRYGVGKRNAVCERCGNMMSWCSICEEWTSTCCIEYGTCLCS